MPRTRGQLLDDVVTQLDKLTALVGDLAELTHGERQTAPPERFRLDQLVDDLVSIGATHGRTPLELEAGSPSAGWSGGRPASRPPLS